MRTPDSFCVQICAFHSDKATAPREPSREQGAVSAAWAWWPKTRKHGNTGTEAPQRPKHENTKTRKHRPPGGSQNTKTRKHGPPGGDQNTKTRKHENTENTAWGYWQLRSVGLTLLLHSGHDGQNHQELEICTLGFKTLHWRFKGRPCGLRTVPLRP